MILLIIPYTTLFPWGGVVPLDYYIDLIQRFAPSLRKADACRAFGIDCSDALES